MLNEQAMQRHRCRIAHARSDAQATRTLKSVRHGELRHSLSQAPEHSRRDEMSFTNFFFSKEWFERQNAYSLEKTQARCDNELA